jgi:hypothetical protein
MPPQVEELADDKVKLTVDVPAHDVHHAVEHAASDLARTVRIPGFRKGKVPMPLLVQRIGRERICERSTATPADGSGCCDPRARRPSRCRSTSSISRRRTRRTGSSRRPCRCSRSRSPPTGRR